MTDLQQWQAIQESSDAMKIKHGDEMQQEHQERPLPAQLTESSHDNYGGHQQGHKKSVLKKVKEKAKKLKSSLIGKKRSDDNKKVDTHNDDDDEEEEEDDDDEEEEEEIEEEEDEEEEEDQHQRGGTNTTLENINEARDLGSFTTDGFRLSEDPKAPRRGSGTHDAGILSMGKEAETHYPVPSPGETIRRQQEVPAAVGQESAGITPILQSTMEVSAPHYEMPSQSIPTLDKSCEFYPAEESVLIPVHGEDNEASGSTLSASEEPSRSTQKMVKENAEDESIVKRDVEQSSETTLPISETTEIADMGSKRVDVESKSELAEEGKPVTAKAMEMLGGVRDRVMESMGQVNNNENEKEKEKEDEGGSTVMEMATSLVGKTVEAVQGFKDTLSKPNGDNQPDSPQQKHIDNNSYENVVKDGADQEKETDHEEGGQGKLSYKDMIINTASSAKNVISSKLGYSHDQTVQEEKDELPASSMQGGMRERDSRPVLPPAI